MNYGLTPKLGVFFCSSGIIFKDDYIKELISICTVIISDCIYSANIDQIAVLYLIIAEPIAVSSILSVLWG